MKHFWFVLLAGCAAAAPPRGPEYTPTNSAEAPTHCPKEAEAAKKAREDALGSDEGSELATHASPGQEKAARAVLAHADCEARALDGMPLDSSEPELFRQQIAAARTQFYTVKTLLDEVVSTGLPELVVLAYARLGDLHAAYANKLRHSDPGPAVAQDRQHWMQEVETVAAPIEQDAAKMYDQALDAVELGPPSFVSDANLGATVTHVCEALGERDLTAAQSHQACRRR